MQWQLIDNAEKTAEENMQHDKQLLEQLIESKCSVLHLYDWKGECATYGYFVDPQHYLNMEAVHSLNLNLAKRPTGGGIIFHICDLAFSVLVPASSPDFSDNTLDNYAFVNNKVIQAIHLFLGKKTELELLPQENSGLDSHCQAFCMAKPTKYDVMFEGKKIGGAAQRKTKAGFLHQGSIALASLSEEYLTKVLRSDTLVLEGMRKNSHSLLGDAWNTASLKSAREQLRDCLKQIFLNKDN